MGPSTPASRGKAKNISFYISQINVYSSPDHYDAALLANPAAGDACTSLTALFYYFCFR